MIGLNVYNKHENNYTVSPFSNHIKKMKYRLSVNIVKNTYWTIIDIRKIILNNCVNSVNSYIYNL